MGGASGPLRRRLKSRHASALVGNMCADTQLVFLSAADAATKYGRLECRALSAFSIQLLKRHRDHEYDFGLLSAETSLNLRRDFEPFG